MTNHRLGPKNESLLCLFFNPLCISEIVGGKMSLVNSDGLAATIDTVNDVFFYNREIQPAERLEVARSIASHQGLPGSYADMFGPMTRPLYVFTGEAITSGAACSHILGEECCRALLKL